MLKKRIIVTLLFKNEKIVKGKNFDNYKVVGNADTLLKIFSSQETDEIQLINLDKSKDKSNFNKIAKLASRECKMPLTIGGGIKNINDVKKLFDLGADKILITSSSVFNKKLLNQVITIYGSQALVVGIEYLKIKKKFVVTKNNGKVKTKKDIFKYAEYLEKVGVGEILLISINNDGVMNGFDISINKKISSLVNVPVIASCGAGDFNHIYEIFKKTSVQGVTCGSIFYFADNNPIRLRTYLVNRNIFMRKVR
mgnify:CR=1 FL=1